MPCLVRSASLREYSASRLAAYESTSDREDPGLKASDDFHPTSPRTLPLLSHLRGNRTPRTSGTPRILDTPGTIDLAGVSPPELELPATCTPSMETSLGKPVQKDGILVHDPNHSALTAETYQLYYSAKRKSHDTPKIL